MNEIGLTCIFGTLYDRLLVARVLLMYEIRSSVDQDQVLVEVLKGLGSCGSSCF